MEGVVEFVDESRDGEGRNVGKVRVAMQNDRVTHSHEGIHNPCANAVHNACVFFLDLMRELS